MLLSIYPSSQTATGDAIAGIIVILMILSVWRVRKAPHKLSSFGITAALVLCLFHYIFPQTGGDFLSYKEWVESVGFTNTDYLSNYYLHYEKVYYVIVNFVHNNYLLFRLVVWGSSLALFCITARRLKLDFNVFVFFLCIFIVPSTSTSRVCLAYAIAFSGYSFLVEPLTRKGSRLLSIVIGSSLIILSLFFHRTAFFLLLTMPLSILDFNKKTLWVFAVAFPIMVIFLNYNLFGLLLNYNQTDNALIDAETAAVYFYADKKVFGLGHIVRLVLYYGGCLAIGYLILKCIMNRSYMSWPKPIRKFANVALVITIIAAAFLLTGGNTYKTFERFINFSVFPQCVFLTYLLKNGYEKKMIRLIVLLLTSSVIYNIVYDDFYLGGA